MLSIIALTILLRLRIIISTTISITIIIIAFLIHLWLQLQDLSGFWSGFGGVVRSLLQGIG